MKSYIKLLWDFRGQSGKKTAEHHRVHLIDYIKAKDLTLTQTGIEIISDMHSVVFLHVSEQEMEKVKNTLKPHRGERITQSS